jgi:hypothetical protein
VTASRLFVLRLKKCFTPPDPTPPSPTRTGTPGPPW